MDTIIQVDTLRKTYGKTVAIDGISFEVRRGEIFGMVGPNGAGKTTTIEILEGLRKPDGGTVCVLGINPQRNPHVLREQTGMQLQSSNLQDRLKVWEALDLYASFYPNASNWKELLSQLGLEEKQNAPFSKLSGGQKQRCFIALALLPDPQLVFLDELTTGLDPQARHAIWDLIRDIQARGKTVMLTTHFMEEAENLCDRVAILNHGQFVAMDTPSALIHSLDAEERVIFSLDCVPSAVLQTALTNLGRVEIHGVKITVQAKVDHRTPLVSEVVNLLNGLNISFRDLRTEQPNLEDVFLSLTGRTMRE
jgi:ABC-2 type transport system ATP-binding protein